MDSIIAYRSDIPPANDYPRRIVSPPVPGTCCMDHMARIGHPAIDAAWRFYYKRCSACGFTVRCFYAPSLIGVLQATEQIRLALAEMNLGTGKRKRRTRAEVEADLAAARERIPRAPRPHRIPAPIRHRKAASSAA